MSKRAVDADMYDRVLVATDGSQGADRAVEHGLTFAERFDATIDALYVVDVEIERLAGDDEAGVLLEASEKAGRRALAQIVERNPDIEVNRNVRYGTPYEEILACIDERGADLAVLGATGAADSRFGSTAERVVTLADVPVLSVPGHETAADTASPSIAPIDDVVVPLDGSDTAERAATHALGVAEQFGSTVHALYVVDTTVYDLADAPRSIVGLLRKGGETTIDEFTREAESMNVQSTGTVVRGRPADEILAHAAGVDADLVVMGTRGRGALPERLLGSTTRRIVRSGTRPVLSIS